VVGGLSQQVAAGRNRAVKGPGCASFFSLVVIGFSRFPATQAPLPLRHVGLRLLPGQLSLEPGNLLSVASSVYLLECEVIPLEFSRYNSMFLSDAHWLVQRGLFAAAVQIVRTMSEQITAQKKSPSEILAYAAKRSLGNVPLL
jgi:hypothetical protein